MKTHTRKVLAHLEKIDWLVKGAHYVVYNDMVYGASESDDYIIDYIDELYRQCRRGIKLSIIEEE